MTAVVVVVVVVVCSVGESSGIADQEQQWGWIVRPGNRGQRQHRA